MDIFVTMDLKDIFNNNNLRWWSFDVKGQRKKAHFLATLYIFYDKETCIVEDIIYEIQEAKIRKTDDNKSFLNDIGIAADGSEKYITVDETHLKEINSKIATEKTTIQSIFKNICGKPNGKSWSRMSDSNTLEIIRQDFGQDLDKFHIKFQRTFRWVFDLMSKEKPSNWNFENFNNMEDKKENYFEEYEKKTFTEKITIFHKNSDKLKKIESQELAKCETKDETKDKTDYSKDALWLQKKGIHLVKQKILESVGNELIFDNKEQIKFDIQNQHLFNIMIKNFLGIDNKEKNECDIQNELLFNIMIKKILDRENTNNINKDETSNKLKDRLMGMILIETQSNNIKNINIDEHNIIYYGVPGTGKTYSSCIKALSILLNKEEEELLLKDKSFIDKEIQKLRNSEQLEIITFHQNFSYEDFIEGIRPSKLDDEDNNQEKTSTNKEGDVLRFKIKNGIFKKIVNNAKKAPDKKYVLIIDEINRGNASKIFGECFTLIESSKRLTYNYKEENWEGAWEVVLPTSNKKFGIPDNLFIIGTMNSSDYSIEHFDAAFRRRFVFKEKEPKPSLITDGEAQNIFKTLNDELKDKFSPDKQIGHSYFMNLENKSIENILDNQIWPLLKSDFSLEQDKVDEIKELISKLTKNTQETAK